MYLLRSRPIADKLHRLLYDGIWGDRLPLNPIVGILVCRDGCAIGRKELARLYADESLGAIGHIEKEHRGNQLSIWRVRLRNRELGFLPRAHQISIAQY